MHVVNFLYLSKGIYRRYISYFVGRIKWPSRQNRKNPQHIFLISTLASVHRRPVVMEGVESNNTFEKKNASNFRSVDSLVATYEDKFRSSYIIRWLFNYKLRSMQKRSIYVLWTKLFDMSTSRTFKVTLTVSVWKVVFKFGTI